MHRKLWQPNLIVFVSSACIMIIELVAGRIMAPYVGVSLYTWTSVIGVVLAGISLGNYLGGRIADRYASPRTLGIVFFVASMASLSIVVLSEIVGNATTPPFLPLIVKITLLTSAIFFLPSCILGAVSPLVIKLTLKDLAQTGGVVGKIYAYSALGSILGTFATGFFLISWFGTRTIAWGVGLILILMGLLFGDWRRAKGRAALMLGIFLGGSLFLLMNGWFRGPCFRETNYYCIKIRDKVLGDDSVVKVLILDRLVHSYTSLDDPTRLVYGYEKIYAEATEYAARRSSPLKTLFIGGGGYTFPRYIEAIYPGSSIEVVEIDPQVTRVAYEELGLSPQTTIVTYNQDARIFFNDLEAERKYNLIIGDAFNDYSVPYHLTTLGFNEEVKKHLQDDGLYVVNIVDGRHRLFLRAYLNTLRETFSHVYLVPVGESWREDVRTTFVIMASQKELATDEFAEIDGGDGERRIAKMILTEQELDELLAEGRRVILTDDYAPVDNLLAPVFEESEARR
ncbi:MAG: fused MFS/spermidine synthase [Anaerolineae bacterium]